ncbi:MAG: right-handed parallel beta-helix repeat-containing protein, partial [Alphaproteobacteria bacterium]|nr:right-handed parallel beta-helix repeat-containing protein [Alphaproteobacteria bacterium]
IRNNRLRNISDDGIQLQNSDFVQIRYNDIADTRGDGIDVEDSDFSVIRNNKIRFVTSNGISVEESAFVDIIDNQVSDVGEAGIFVDPSAFITVAGNTLRRNATGVYFQDVVLSSIENNTIEDNQIGVRLERAEDINVIDNRIASNLIYGLWANGDRNGYMNVSGNVFLNNPTHAKFESGLVDLTGPGNQFLNGNTALYFSPFGGDTTLLSLVDDDAPGYETFPSVASPSNYGGTIGAQFFSGQTNAFVKLDNNAFRAPGGEGIWLNGLNSTYDGAPAGLGLITPSLSGGILSAPEYNFLEDMFIHYPDNAGTTGIFFFGAVPAPVVLPPVAPFSLSLDNVEDFFRQFSAFTPGPSGLSVTITGLPSVTPPGLNPGALARISPAAGAPTPQNLANISPAAGEEDAGVERTANAETPASLDAIEPAASDTNAPCWADAVTAAGNGTVANYSFSGSPEEDIANVASCGSTQS